MNRFQSRPGRPGCFAITISILSDTLSLVSIPTGPPRLFRRDYSAALGNSP